MTGDDWWITRFNDNRVIGILRELRDMIEDCEDPEIVHKLRSSLGLGFVNYCAEKERELRADPSPPPVS